MAANASVVAKYAACTQLDPSSGQCAAVVWVDPPAVIPPLTAQQGALLGGVCILVWGAVIAMVLIRKGARLNP